MWKVVLDAKTQNRYLARPVAVGFSPRIRHAG